MKRRTHLILMIFVSCLFLGGCGTGWWPWSGPDIQYDIQGLDDDAETREYINDIMHKKWEENLSNEDLDKHPYRESYLERVVRKDLVKAMEARGYYNASVRFQDTEGKLSGVYDIQPGKAYTIDTIKIEPKAYEEYADKIPLQEGDILVASNVLQQQESLLNKIRENRCFFSLNIRHAVLLQPEKKTAQLIYQVQDGPEVLFGNTEFTGMETVEKDYLRKLIPWEKGDCFQRQKIEKIQSELLSSGLFAKVDVQLPAPPSAGQEIPVTVNLLEREHRSVRAGVSYYTDRELGVQLGWTHRNLFGEAEKMDVDLNVSKIEHVVEGKFTKPFFMRQDQTLNITSKAGREFTDAYVESGVEGEVSIERSFTEKVKGSTGIGLSLKQIDDEAGEIENFGLVSFPQSLSYDTRDNPLDPKNSWFLKGQVEPFIDVIGDSSPFFKTNLHGRAYVSLDDDDDFILALRSNLGSILGDGVADIPATERFYSGGGGSVRGFGYQEIGPSENGIPTGGRALVEASTELRYKFSDDMGAVAFVDAGQVSKKMTPEFGDPSVGAGVGFRYYTEFGPLRFDVATPITNKQDTRNYQFYISIGQAF